jgi:hypothetical protein
MGLSELKSGLALVGLEPDLVCSVVPVNVISAGADRGLIGFYGVRSLPGRRPLMSYYAGGGGRN